MRIIYTGIFGAAAVRPISGGGFWAAFFAVLLLIPIIMAIRQLAAYIRLRKQGETTDAEIWHTDQLGWGVNRRYAKYYSYSVAGKDFGDVFYTGFCLKKYAVKKTVRVSYDRENPEKHILHGLSVYEPIFILLFTGVPFAALLVLFVQEILKCL